MGRICHPILGRNYIPSLSIRDIFDQIFGLLMAPEPDNPLDRYLKYVWCSIIINISQCIG